MQVLKQETRDRILTAAEYLFFESGFEGTSTRTIAKNAGISVSNLYKYYKDKQALFSAVIDSFYLFTRKDLASLFSEEHSGNEPDIIEATVGKIMNMMLTDRKKFVILINGSAGTEYSHVKEELVDMMASHMHDSINHETLKDTRVLRIIATNFFEGILSIARKYHDDEAAIKDNIDALVRYHMAGIAMFL